MANIKIPDLSQATDIQGSDLLILEQETGTNKVEIDSLFKGGTGIQIENDEISTVFANLPANTDLNTVTYNFRGYAPTPTNAPTSGSFNLDVVCRKDGLSGQQIASKYNDTVVYVRTWYTSSGTRIWNDWRRLSDCYMPGDTATLNQAVRCVGHAGNNTTTSYFEIPIGVKFDSSISSVSFSSMVVSIFGSSGRLLNSIDVVADTTITLMLTIDKATNSIQVRLQNLTGMTAYAIQCVEISSATFTFA